MTARNGRAVRDDPGAASDRRASAGKERARPGRPSLLPARFGRDQTQLSTPWLPGLFPPAPANSLAQAIGRPLRQEQRSPTLHRVYQKSGDDEQQFRETSLPRITVAESYSVLYELEHYRGTFGIMLLLYREGPATTTRMRQRLRPGQRALEHSLDNLTKVRLVRLTRDRSFPFSKSYELTELGKELVETPIRSWPYVLVH